MRKFSFAILLSMFIELAVLILVGKWIGVFPTLLLVILSSAVGGLLIKRVGTHSINEIKQNISRGQAPALPIIRGFLSLIGSVLLIIPGFITSILGLIIIIPFTQNLFKPLVFLWLRKKMKGSKVVIYQK